MGKWTRAPLGRRVLVERAARQLFAMLLEAALMAKWLGEEAKRPVSPDASSELLSLAARIAGPASSSVPTTVRGVASEWLRAEPWSTDSLRPEWRSRLRQEMRALAE